jgi:hypothetical protein
MWWLVLACSGGKEQTDDPPVIDSDPTTEPTTSTDGVCDESAVPIGTWTRLQYDDEGPRLRSACFDAAQATARASFTPPETGRYMVTASNDFGSLVAVFRCDGTEIDCANSESGVFLLEGGETVLIAVQDFFEDNQPFDLLVEPVAQSEDGACDDEVDNDDDGRTDCDDRDCAEDAACDEVCDDGQDDNRNGLVDCSDPMCDDAPNCAFECPTDVLPTALPASVTGDLTGAPNQLFSNDCQGQGPEEVWAFTAPADDTYVFSVDGDGCPVNLGLFDTCAPGGEQACAVDDRGTASLSRVMLTGETLYVVVEAYDQEPCGYTLEVE